MWLLLGDHNARKEQKSDKTPNRLSSCFAPPFSPLPINLPAVTDGVNDN
jgi:hypothetical protein